MVTAEEKHAFMQTMIKQFNTADVDLLQSQLHALLLRDTNNGKMYKYRSFDKHGRSLEALRNGTLYCSKPTAFNDPFECKVGITVKSLMEAQYNIELDLLSAIFEKYIAIQNGSLKLNDCSDDEQRIIKKLLENQILTHYISENRNVDRTIEQETKYLAENAFVITELLQTVLSDEAFAGSLGFCSQMLPKLFAQITPEGLLEISKDSSSYEDFARAQGITDDADEIALTMQMINKLYPEKTEAADDIQQLIDKFEKEMLDSLGNMFLIGCLCTDFKNRLMWSHYADSHKGFCVEFDFSGDDKSAFFNLPFPIYYTDARPLIPWKAAFDNSQQNITDASVDLMLAVLTKDKAWEYENEWRILISASEKPNLKMPKITCIYLGAAIEEKNRLKIIKIAQEQSIPVKQMKVDRGEYGLHAENIDVNSYNFKKTKSSK